MLIKSGLLQVMDNVVFKNSGDSAASYAVVVVHSKFDGFGLPSDYEAVIRWLQEKVWPQSAFTGLAIATLRFLSEYPEAKKVMMERNVLASLQVGDTTQYQEYAQVIVKNLSVA
jgi:hypothetical protein